MPRAVVLDAFGTTVTPVARIGPYHKVLKGAEDFRAARMAALTLNKTLPELAGHLNLGSVGDHVMEELELEVSGIRAFPDTLPFLANLRERKVAVAVCSNLASAYGDKVRQLLKDCQHFIFSYEVGLVKPDAGIYQAVSDVLGVRPDETVFIGDTSAADVDGPIAFGMKAALLKRSTGDNLWLALERALGSR